MKSTDMRRIAISKTAGKRPPAAETPPPVENGEIHQRAEERGKICRDTLLQLFLEKSNMIAYEYDVVKDETSYLRATPGEGLLETHQKDFYDRFANSILADTEERDDVLARLKDACKRMRDDIVEYRIQTEKHGILWRRTSYRSLATKNGDIYAVVGLMEDITDEERLMEHQEARLKRDPQTRLFNRDGLELLVNRQLIGLSRGEKGVLFIVGIDHAAQLMENLGPTAYNGYIGALSDSVRADFRGVDVFGRINEQEVAVFISGRISIDIIEKRAQRILDLFLRVQPQDFRNITFSMGISVTGSPDMRFSRLCQEAEEAMLSARKFGPNRCRMYDEIKP